MPSQVYETINLRTAGRGPVHRQDRPEGQVEEGQADRGHHERAHRGRRRQRRRGGGG